MDELRGRVVITRGSTRRRPFYLRALTMLATIGALVVGQLLLPSVVAADPVCQTSMTTITKIITSTDPDSPINIDAPDPDDSDDPPDTPTHSDLPVIVTSTTTVTQPVSVKCVDTVTSTQTDTTTQTTTSTNLVPTTETTTVPTTVTTSVPTTVEIPTTVENPIFETTTVTEGGENVGSTGTERVVEGVTQTETQTNSVEVTWGYAATVNPATGQIPAVSVSESQLDPGDTVTVSATGFSAGELVRIELHSDPVVLGEVAAGQDGTVQAVVTIPLDAQAGQHAIRVVGLSCAIEAAIPLTVVGAPPAVEPAFLSGTEFLSYTGVNSQLSITIAVALIAAGAGMVVLTRRTRHPVVQGPASSAKKTSPGAHRIQKSGPA